MEFYSETFYFKIYVGTYLERSNDFCLLKFKKDFGDQSGIWLVTTANYFKYGCLK